MASQHTKKTLQNGINALLAGAGTPIVCLPGWPQTAEAFAEVIPLLARSHQAITLDPPGLDDSSPSKSGYDTKTISNTLADAVAAELPRSTRFHLVGHDVGAWIAYAWAAQHGPSLLSLTLIGSMIPGLTPPLAYPLPDEANIRLWQFAFNRIPELPEALAQGRERVMLDWLFDRKSAHPERITPSKRDHYVSAYARPGGMADGFAYYRAVPESMRQNREEFSGVKLATPVLAIGGRQATGETVRVTLDFTARASDSSLVVIEDCGHYVMEEQPEATATAILNFLEKHE